MIRLFEFLMHGCWHEWEPTGHKTNHFDISFGRRSFMYTAHQTKCTKCGRYGMFKDKAGEQ